MKDHLNVDPWDLDRYTPAETSVLLGYYEAKVAAIVKANQR